MHLALLIYQGFLHVAVTTMHTWQHGTLSNVCGVIPILRNTPHSHTACCACTLRAAFMCITAWCFFIGLIACPSHTLEKFVRNSFHQNALQDMYSTVNPHQGSYNPTLRKLEIITA